MKVLVLDSHQESDARIQRHVKYLLEHGIEVYRVNYNYYNKDKKPGFFSHFGERGYRINAFSKKGDIIFFNLLRRLSIVRLFECLNLIKKLDLNPKSPLIIHVHDPHLLLLAIMLMKTKLSNSKIVYDRHELYEKMKHDSKIIFPLINEILSKYSISGIVTVSEYHVKNTKKIFSKQNIIIIPNYPSSGDYDNEVIKKKIENIRKDSLINAIYIGSLNNLFDRDLDLLLDIADFILQKHTNVNFILGGTNLTLESEVRINALSKKYGNRFQFLGYVEREKTIELTQNAHIGFYLIRPNTKYWVKSSPNKVYEYLMCGVIPIIRADVDNSKDLADCSLIFGRSEDKEIIINETLNLLDNFEKIKRYMKLAYDISLNYTWESVANRYLELYNQLLTPSPNHQSDSDDFEKPMILREKSGPFQI